VAARARSGVGVGANKEKALRSGKSYGVRMIEHESDGANGVRAEQRDPTRAGVSI
jgi:hypothetical protein